MKTVYRAILQVGSAHPKYVSVTIQSGILRAIAGQWWVSESSAWSMASISIDNIAHGLHDRAEDCRDMANATKAVPA
jgi:hypothetical protein